MIEQQLSPSFISPNALLLPKQVSLILYGINTTNYETHFCGFIEVKKSHIKRVGSEFYHQNCYFNKLFTANDAETTSLVEGYMFPSNCFAHYSSLHK